MVRQPFIFDIFGSRLRDSRLPPGIIYTVESVYCGGLSDDGCTYHNIWEITDDHTNVMDEDTGKRKTFKWAWKGNKPHDIDPDFCPYWSLIQNGAASPEEYEKELAYRIDAIAAWQKSLHETHPATIDPHWFRGRWYPDPTYGDRYVALYGGER